MTLFLDCLLADADIAASYSDGLLNQADTARLLQTPDLAQRLDWRVSRVLKSQLLSSHQSLSHSHGYAALLSCDSDIPLGIDIEKIKPRDFAALSAWICSPSEQAYLAMRRWQAQDYYRLWCIKEALLKAARLNFPADMVHVGYTFSANQISGLRVYDETDWHGFSALLQTGFAFACVWKSPVCPSIRRHVYGTLNIADIHNLHFTPPTDIVR